MNVIDYLKKAVELNAADIFIVANLPVSMRINGKISQVSDKKLTPADTRAFLEEIYTLSGNRDFDNFVDHGDDDFSFAIPGLSRFRVNAYKQRGSLAAIIRVISFALPDYNELGIPSRIMELCSLPNGLVLITGPAGSGKSTTLASMVKYINNNYNKHIITLEDPLEYLHRHDKSIVSQREINIDTESYVTALRASLRQSPDVVLLGEMRDYETTHAAITAAETGHLIFSTVHTIGAANTIDRILDVFPPNQQRQISFQLSMTLQAIITQQLIPSTDGDLVLAFEIMTMTPAIRNMIRESKIPQIDALVYSSATDDLISMDAYLANLYKEGRITKDTALTYATNPNMLSKRLK